MSTPPVTPPRPSVAVLILHALRGGLIGTAELLPGISGGTIALLTGVYERILRSADHVVSAAKALVFGPARAAGFRDQMRRVDWWLVVPLLVGMGAVVLTLAGPIEHLVTENPELARGLFFGLVAASMAVPLRLAARAPRGRAGAPAVMVVVFIAAAALSFFVVWFAGGTLVTDPPLWVVFFAAAIAVCALVVPGVSGSFFLLAIGLYTPTLHAVAERDLAYLGVFALGAIVGLITIVRVMTWLLDHWRRLTLVAMAGLMLGSLRALWPWQETPAGDDHGIGELVAPYDPVWGPILLALLGAAIVVGLLLVERHLPSHATADSRTT